MLRGVVGRSATVMVVGVRAQRAVCSTLDWMAPRYVQRVLGVAHSPQQCRQLHLHRCSSWWAAMKHQRSATAGMQALAVCFVHGRLHL